MELSQQKKLVKNIFRLLKVNEIVIPIGRTNKGNLGLKFSEGNDDFEIYLDAVPLSTKDMLVDDNNIELKKVLEKYLFDQGKGLATQIHETLLKDNPFLSSAVTPLDVNGSPLVVQLEKRGGDGEIIDIPLVVEKKKRGRPSKAK